MQSVRVRHHTLVSCSKAPLSRAFSACLLLGFYPGRAAWANAFGPLGLLTHAPFNPQPVPAFNPQPGPPFNPQPSTFPVVTSGHKLTNHLQLLLARDGVNLVEFPPIDGDPRLANIGDLKPHFRARNQ